MDPFATHFVCTLALHSPLRVGADIEENVEFRGDILPTIPLQKREIDSDKCKRMCADDYRPPWGLGGEDDYERRAGSVAQALRVARAVQHSRITNRTGVVLIVDDTPDFEGPFQDRCLTS